MEYGNVLIVDTNTQSNIIQAMMTLQLKFLQRWTKMTFVINPALIVSHVHSDKLLFDKEGEVRESFIRREVQVMKHIGLNAYLAQMRINKNNLCQYFTNITSSLRPITDIQLSS